MKKWTIVAGLLTVLLLAAGCITIGSSPAPATKLAIIEHDMTGAASDNVSVKITIKNTGLVTAELAQVTVNFYDADKELVYTSSDSVMNLHQGETWEFEITCRGSRCNEVKSYDIESMAGSSSGGL
ncbi:FxLYD domain-containing protein [Chloroflexota bacterium]